MVSLVVHAVYVLHIRMEQKTEFNSVIMVRVRISLCTQFNLAT